MNVLSDLICPACKSNDHCKYVFAHHYAAEDKCIREDNPSDYQALYICPNIHVFDSKGNLVKQEE